MTIEISLVLAVFVSCVISGSVVFTLVKLIEWDVKKTIDKTQRNKDSVEGV